MYSLILLSPEKLPDCSPNQRPFPRAVWFVSCFFPGDTTAHPAPILSKHPYSFPFEPRTLCCRHQSWPRSVWVLGSDANPKYPSLPWLTSFICFLLSQPPAGREGREGCADSPPPHAIEFPFPPNPSRLPLDLFR